MCQSFRRLSVTVLCLVTLPALAGEGRIPVFESPTIITAPGKYIVTRNLPFFDQDAIIRIYASGVDLDLNGMTLDQSGNLGSEVILIPFSEKDITIHDGTLIGGLNGITLGQGVAPVAGNGDGRLIIERVTIKDPAEAGIKRTGTVPTGNGLTVRNCVIQGAGTHGIDVDNTDVPTAVVSFVAEDNVIQNVSGHGIRIDGPTFGKIVGNVIREVSGGISMDLDLTNSDKNLSDNLLMNNNVSANGNVGILVSGDRNEMRENLLNSNLDWGLQFAAGATDNLYRKNMARKNCPSLACTCILGSPTDSCDDNLAGNTSSGDNFLPGLQ